MCHFDVISNIHDLLESNIIGIVKKSYKSSFVMFDFFIFLIFFFDAYSKKLNLKLSKHKTEQYTDRPLCFRRQVKVYASNGIES